MLFTTKGKRSQSVKAASLKEDGAPSTKLPIRRYLPAKKKPILDFAFIYHKSFDDRCHLMSATNKAVYR